MGIDKMSVLGNSRFIVEAYKSLSEIYSQVDDFQNAFMYLKKANEIQDMIDKDDSVLF
jgi:hypothetical protein